MCHDDQGPLDLIGTPARGRVYGGVYARRMSDLLSPLVQPGVELGSFNLSDPEFWNAPREFREGAFHTLRTQAPLTFWEEWDFPTRRSRRAPATGRSTTYNDVWHVNRNPQIFSSAGGITVPDSQPEMNEFFGSMIAMDDPRHYRLRSIVAKGFTPKETAKIEELRQGHRRRRSSTACSRSTPTARATSSPSSPRSSRCRSSAR